MSEVIAWHREVCQTSACKWIGIMRDGGDKFYVSQTGFGGFHLSRAPAGRRYGRGRSPVDGWWKRAKEAKSYAESLAIRESLRVI